MNAKLFGLITTVLLAIALVIAVKCCITQKDEVNRQSNNVKAMAGDIAYYQLRDSLETAVVGALEFKVGELEKYRADDAELIKDLNLRLKDVRTITKINTVTHDSVAFILIDSCFDYKDRWTSFNGCLGGNFEYSVRDSVASIINVEYQRHFLWWRWRPCYNCEIVNFNPNSHLVYGEATVMGGK